jgi:glycosyltransferase 2 family protein
MTRRILSIFIKGAVTLTALFFVIKKLNYNVFIKSLEDINLFWPFMAFLYYNLSQIISSYRLRLLLNARGVKTGLYWNAMLYYTGLFYNMFLPGGLGGDGYKVYTLNKISDVRIRSLFLIMALDRLSGMVALLNIAAILLIFSDFRTVWPLLRILPVFTSLTGIVYIYAIRRWFPVFRSVTFKVLAYAFILQSFQVIAALFMTEAFQRTGQFTEYINYLALFLISAAASLMPVTIGGVGAREVVYYYGFSILGYEPSAGVAFSFMLFIMVALTSLSGLIFIPYIERTAVRLQKELRK